MTTILIAFALAFAVAIAATQIVMVLATRLDIVDRPDGLRKRHARTTPLLGGVAIFVAFLAPIIALFQFSRFSTVSELLFKELAELQAVAICALLALALGVIDDKVDLRARYKLLGQIIVATAAYWLGFRISNISSPFGGSLALGIFAYPVTVFWFVGCMNAVNLLDGIDGLAAGMSLFVALILFLVGLQFNSILAMFLMAALVGATLGFLLFNFPPAKIFLGDSGTMLLGFLIASLSIIGGTRKAEAAVALFVPVVALGLPIIDTVVAIIRRWYRRLPISAPDRQHIHHLLISMGYGQRRTVLILYAICVVLGAAALLITMGRSEVIILLMGSLVIVAFVSVRIFSGVRFLDVLHKLSADDVRRRRVTHARLVVERAIDELRRVPDMEALWDVCKQTFRELELHHARLLVLRSKGQHAGGGGEADLLQSRRSETWEWESGRDGERPTYRLEDVRAASSTAVTDSWCVTLALMAGKRPLGHLLICRNAGDNLTAFESPELLDQLRAVLAESVGRLTQ